MHEVPPCIPLLANRAKTWLHAYAWLHVYAYPLGEGKVCAHSLDEGNVYAYPLGEGNVYAYTFEGKVHMHTHGASRWLPRQDVNTLSLMRFTCSHDPTHCFHCSHVHLERAHLH